MESAARHRRPVELGDADVAVAPAEREHEFMPERLRAIGMPRGGERDGVRARDGVVHAGGHVTGELAGRPLVAADEESEVVGVCLAARDQLRRRRCAANKYAAARRELAGGGEAGDAVDHDGTPRARARGVAAPAREHGHAISKRYIEGVELHLVAVLRECGAERRAELAAALEARVDAATERHAGAAPRVVVGQKQNNFVPRVQTAAVRVEEGDVLALESARVRGPDGDDAAQPVPEVALRVAVAAFVQACGGLAANSGHLPRRHAELARGRHLAPRPLAPAVRADQRCPGLVGAQELRLERAAEQQAAGLGARRRVRPPPDTRGRLAARALLRYVVALARRREADGAELGADVAPLAVRRLVRWCVLGRVQGPVVVVVSGERPRRARRRACCHLERLVLVTRACRGPPEPPRARAARPQGAASVQQGQN